MCKPCDHNSNEVRFILGAAVLFFLGYWLFNGCQYVEDCRPATQAQHAEFMFNRYQTLITGIIALYVGFITVGVVREQIAAEFQRVEREKQEKIDGKVRVFQMALKDHLKRFDRFHRLCQIKTRSINGFVPIFIQVEQRLWDYLPKAPSNILMDWDYFSDLTERDAEAYVEIRSLVEVMSAYTETLEVTKNNNMYQMSTAKFDKFIQRYLQLRQEIVAQMNETWGAS